MPVLTRSDGEPRVFAARAAAPDDQWQDALRKLFPTEVFAAYLATVAILASVPASAARNVVAWIVYGMGALATVVYMSATWDDDPQVRRSELRYAWPQLILAVVAFTCWAFSIGGAFTVFAWYEPWIGGVILICGSLLLTGLNKLLGTLAQ